MSSGGLQVGIVGTDDNTMVALANSIRDLIEIRKFACQMEEVLFVSYDEHKFAGEYITEAERIKAKLPKDQKHNSDEL